MYVIFIVILVFVSLAAVYFYNFLKKSFRTFGADLSKRGVKAVITVSAVLLGVGSVNIISVSSIVILHIMFIGILMQLVNLIIKLIVKNNSGFWKKLYESGILPVLLAAVIMIGGYFNMHNVVKTQYTVYTDKDIRKSGYRVALISDVHFGVSLNQEELIEKCRQISSEKPDVVVLCGDIVDNGTTKEQMQNAFETLGKIYNKYGVFFVYGNHDRPMSAVKSDYTEAELKEAITENGITVLKDESFVINGELSLVGREDLSAQRMGGGRASVSDLISEINKDDFILMLDHQPNEYKENAKEGTDLILSGHTHGGQIWPANIIQSVFNINDAVYGHINAGDNTEAIVSSGFAGWKYPIKTSAPSEYVIIDIKKHQ